ncbi:hypothetical protein [Sorangium sp. So ce406]|uniref:hypothetical protein n=1 Tax=Sorangium sp. So ce406 TaxID=3133311 RepID=UPI003F5C0C63
MSSGPVRCVDDLDCGLPADCQRSSCIAGACVGELAPAGSPCNDGLSECDGAGECLGAECTEDSDCTDCGWSDTCICLGGMCFILEE